MVGSFGKRGRAAENSVATQKVTRSNWGASAAPQMAPVDSDGMSRVFSKDLFKGETGDFLRGIGITPDHPMNIAQTTQTFATLDQRYRQELAHIVKRLDLKLPDGSFFKPLMLVPEHMWQGEYRNFLCATCKFYPADPTNIFFLAGTAQAAQMLSLPMRTRLSAKEIAESAQLFVAKVAELYRANCTKSGEQVAEQTAHHQARSLGMFMSVKMFSVAETGQEEKWFGSLMNRDFKTMLPSDA